MTDPTPLEKAIAFATEKHAGQKDKAGQPYILHPLRIMSRMETDDARVAAVLHDVVEDCPGVTFDDLAALGISARALAAVETLTHRPGEPYDDYIERVCGNALARRVKLGDLADNMDLMRLTDVGERDIRRFNKYLKARKRLLRD